MKFKVGHFYTNKFSMTECFEVTKVNYTGDGFTQIVGRRWTAGFYVYPILKDHEEVVYFVKNSENWREIDLERLCELEVTKSWRA